MSLRPKLIYKVGSRPFMATLVKTYLKTNKQTTKPKNCNPYIHINKK